MQGAVGICPDPDCSGSVIRDADFISGDGDEIWWDYRCVKCGDTFQNRREFLPVPIARKIVGGFGYEGRKRIAVDPDEPRA